MNPTNENAPATDHLRYEVAQLEKMRQQIISDMEALRTQEQNLRSYEARLRQAPAAQATPAPAAGSHGLDAEREKLNRLRGLLEAERRSLVDERLAVREEREMLTHKAEELRQRAAWLEVCERDFKARSFEAPTKKIASATPLGFRLGLNEVPFAEYFRSQRRSA